jgi:hypothetical protein
MTTIFSEDVIGQGKKTPAEFINECFDKADKDKDGFLSLSLSVSLRLSLSLSVSLSLLYFFHLLLISLSSFRPSLL